MFLEAGEIEREIPRDVSGGWRDRERNSQRCFWRLERSREKFPVMVLKRSREKFPEMFLDAGEIEREIPSNGSGGLGRESDGNFSGWFE
ncbi:MAG: hypothetical protein IPM23_23835 [Candidatus Melainabacteria bacterium]|nr:hypothetical protein [Candidatus Melainabacteria bacterium]